MKNEIMQIILNLIGIEMPIFSDIKEIYESSIALSDKIFLDKIYHIIVNQDSDFNDWLKLSEKFEEDNKNYEKAVKQIIYTINAINEIDMLNAYSNLLRSYKLGFICKNDFLRLGFILTKLFSEDAQYLSTNIKGKNLSNNVHTIALTSNNLMYEKVGYNSSISCDFTSLGHKLDKYALSYGNETKYKYP